VACAEGVENKAVSQELGVHAMTVGKWRCRFLDQRVEGLRDEPRPGTPRMIDDQRIEAIITRTLESQPDDATHWSSRGMARDSGLSVSTVQGIWRAFGLKPHRQETFKLSTDPDFVAKVRDVVGLYMAPPEHALVLCVDEKSQIQALDRSQAVFPMRPGQPERRSHDYARHGTTSLFAALDIATGAVIGQCYPCHRAEEFRQFLDEIEVRVPRDLDVHLIWDNSDLGQLCHAQDHADPRLAGEASALARASDPDQQFLAEPSRALLCHTHRKPDPPRRSSQRRGTRSRHHGLPRQA
jgi:transposase